MKITYELDPYEDRTDLILIQNAYKYWNALWNITNGKLRRWANKGEWPEEIQTPEQMIDAVWELIMEALEGIDLDEVE